MPDSKASQWFSTYMAEGRKGNMNENHARQRAVQAVQKKLFSEFGALLIKSYYLSNKRN